LASIGERLLLDDLRRCPPVQLAQLRHVGRPTQETRSSPSTTEADQPWMSARLTPPSVPQSPLHSGHDLL